MVTEEELTLLHITVAAAGAREVKNQTDAIVSRCKMDFFSHVTLDKPSSEQEKHGNQTVFIHGG